MADPYTTAGRVRDKTCPVPIDRTIDGTHPVAIREWPGSGPVVLFIHGGGLNAAMWDRCAELLGDNHHRVAVDLQSHGQSPLIERPLSYEIWLADVDAALDAVGAEQAVIVGHSWGGRVAIGYALAHAHRCLAVVAVDGGLIDFGGRHATLLPSPEDRDQFIAGMRGDPVEGYAGSPTSLSELLTDSVPAVAWRKVIERSFVVVGDHVEHRPTPERYWEAVELERSGAVPPPSAYADLSCPTLLLFATEYPVDESSWPFAPAATARLHGAYGFDVRYIESDHNIPITAPRAVADHISDFLAGRL